MRDSQQRDRRTARRELANRVAADEQRKEQARQRQHQAIWFGFGMFGLVGWSIAVPALLGVAIGAWVDSNWPSRYSWTLMLLLMGIALGCLTAWRWIRRESQDPEED